MNSITRRSKHTVVSIYSIKPQHDVPGITIWGRGSRECWKVLAIFKNHLVSIQTLISLTSSTQLRRISVSHVVSAKRLSSFSHLLYYYSWMSIKIWKSIVLSISMSSAASPFQITFIRPIVSRSVSVPLWCAWPKRMDNSFLDLLSPRIYLPIGHEVQKMKLLKVSRG